MSQNAINATKHGKCYTATYKSWQSMKGRCKNPNNPAYSKYGAKGIKVCARWNDFENFYSDMGNRPQGSSIDRINSNGNYEPSNCRWADRQTQNMNRNNVRRHKGLTIREWSELTGIKSKTIRARLNDYKWSWERAIKNVN